MPPLITGASIPSRTQQGGVEEGRQLKVTARCHTTVQSYYISQRLRRSSPSSHDGQMTIIPALLFHSASSSPLSHGWSVSHQSCLKMKLYVGIISPTLIPDQLSCDLSVDLFVFLWPYQFTNLRLYSFGWSEKVCEQPKASLCLR